MPLAAAVGPAVGAAFAAGPGETAVVAGLAEAGPGGATAATFAGEMAGEAAAAAVEEKLPEARTPRAPEVLMEKLRALDWSRVMLEVSWDQLGLGSRRTARFPPQLARVFQCSTSPDPTSFCPAQRGVRRDNHAARYDAHPICDRCPKPHNRRELAGCDSKRSHSRRKFGGHGRPYPTSAQDRGHFLLRPFADRGARFGNSE